MIVQNDFLKEVKGLGLNSYEAKLWTALLSRGISTAGELSDIAGVPRSRSYDVLESLEKKGFIILKIAKPIKYIAVPPSEVVERVKKKIQQEAEEQEKLLNDIQESDVLKELTLLHSNGIDSVDPNEITGAVKGRDNIYGHYERLIKDAKESVLIVTNAEALTKKFDSIKKALKKAKTKGVKTTVVGDFKTLSDELKTELNALATIKEKDVDARLLVVDNKQIAFMLQDSKEVHPSYDLGVWVNTPYFADFLTKLVK